MNELEDKYIDPLEPYINLEYDISEEERNNDWSKWLEIFSTFENK